MAHLMHSGKRSRLSHQLFDIDAVDFNGQPKMYKVKEQMSLGAPERRTVCEPAIVPTKTYACEEI